MPTATMVRSVYYPHTCRRVITHDSYITDAQLLEMLAFFSGSLGDQGKTFSDHYIEQSRSSFPMPVLSSCLPLKFSSQPMYPDLRRPRSHTE